MNGISRATTHIIRASHALVFWLLPSRTGNHVPWYKSYVIVVVIDLLLMQIVDFLLHIIHIKLVYCSPTLCWSNSIFTHVTGLFKIDKQGFEDNLVYLRLYNKSIIWLCCIFIWTMLCTWFGWINGLFNYCHLIVLCAYEQSTSRPGMFRRFGRGVTRVVLIHPLTMGRVSIEFP